MFNQLKAEFKEDQQFPKLQMESPIQIFKQVSNWKLWESPDQTSQFIVKNLSIRVRNSPIKILKMLKEKTTLKSLKMYQFSLWTKF